MIMVNSEWKEKLQTELVKIGWNLQYIGCDVYRIINHKDELTNFELRGTDLTLRCDTAFGLKASEHGMSGTVCLVLSGCEFQHYNNCISIGYGTCFISFYNFDMIRK